MCSNDSSRTEAGKRCTECEKAPSSLSQSDCWAQFEDRAD